MAQHVDIPRRTGLGCFPHLQHQRAFQHEAVGMFRLAQTIEKTLHDEKLQHFLERPALLVRQVQQTLPNRGCNILRHRLASRYGRMTFSTRQIRAYSRSFGKSGRPRFM